MELVNSASIQLLTLQVVYATEREQIVVNIQAPEGTTLHEAVRLSGLRERFPQQLASRLVLGVYGRILDPEAPANNGDRIEIYRPLIADPKVARRQRAARSKHSARSE